MKQKIIAMITISILLMLVIPITSAEILENHNCLVMGITTNTWFGCDDGLLASTIIALAFLFFEYPQLFVLLFYIIFFLVWRIPIKREVGVGFGLWTVDMLGGNYQDYPASGWIKTVGDNGTIEYKGTFWGDILTFGVFYNMFTEAGMTGFKGIRKSIIHPITHLPVYFIGYAKHFRIDTVEECYD